MLASLAIGGADPSAFLSTPMDGLANEPALAEARMDPSGNQLVAAVTGELQTAEGRANAYEGSRDRALAGLKPVSYTHLGIPSELRLLSSPRESSPTPTKPKSICGAA